MSSKEADAGGKPRRRRERGRAKELTGRGESEREIGSRVRRVRTEIADLTQAEFAERLGVTRASVYGWEAGMGIKRANIEAICREFNVSAEWLALDIGEPIPRPPDGDELDRLLPLLNTSARSALTAVARTLFEQQEQHTPVRQTERRSANK